MLGQEEIETFHTQGYLVVPNVLVAEEISELETECGRICETLSRSDCIYEPVPPKVLEKFPKARDSYGEYASIRSRWPLSERVMGDVLLSERIQSLVRAVIPDDPRLFNEQYIIKPSHSGTAGSFGWHRDSDGLSCIGMAPENVTYMSLWIALDDMTEENGCLVVRPLTGSQEIHLEVPRGSGILMSHTLYHKSGPNTTNFQRRAWMPQFSKGPIWNSDGDHPLSLALSLCPTRATE